MGRESRIGERMRPAVYRGLTVVVVVIVTAGVVWALASPATQIPQRIAAEAAPELDWTLVVSPEERQGLARVPGVGRLVDPGRGEWTWHVTGSPQVLTSEVTAWLLERPPPDPSGEDGWVAEVAADRGLEGRIWDGELIAAGTTTLRGAATTALRSVTVTVVIQPLPISDGISQITVRVD